jgi:ABC-2 type transport system permease protein
MNLRRFGVLLMKELVQGPKSFMFILAVIMPLALSLVVSLVFGTFFSERARLGLLDEGQSALTSQIRENPAVLLSLYNSQAELVDAVGRGAADMGLILPAGFDARLQSGEPARMEVYVWGESQLQHRIVTSTALLNASRQVAGHATPVEIVQTLLGEGSNIPWEQRLLPLLVLLSIMVGGLMIPSTSLVNEKEKHTLNALAITPATLTEVFLAKGLMGALVSIFSAVMILALNRSFGGQPLLLISALALGAAFSASLGVLMGALIKDISSLFAIIKGTGIFLYGPAVVYMFPEIPQWIARLFPTYYIINPILEITQNRAGLAEVWVELAILTGLILATGVVIFLVAEKTHLTAAARG